MCCSSVRYIGDKRVGWLWQRPSLRDSPCSGLSQRFGWKNWGTGPTSPAWSSLLVLSHSDWPFSVLDAPATLIDYSYPLTELQRLICEICQWYFCPKCPRFNENINGKYGGFLRKIIYYRFFFKYFHWRKKRPKSCEYTISFTCK